jgi:hypothetical protein
VDVFLDVDLADEIADLAEGVGAPFPETPDQSSGKTPSTPEMPCAQGPTRQ